MGVDEREKFSREREKEDPKSGKTLRSVFEYRMDELF